MSTTVHEALMNAQINFINAGDMGASMNPIFKIAMGQMNNAMEALENGLNLDDVIQEQLLGEVKTSA